MWNSSEFCLPPPQQHAESEFSFHQIVKWAGSHRSNPSGRYMQSSQCGWRQRPDRRRDDVRRERYCGPNDVLRRITSLKGNLPNKAKSHFFVTAVAQIIRTDGCDGPVSLSEILSHRSPHRIAGENDFLPVSGLPYLEGALAWLPGVARA